jgi:3-oxoacyl-[acyl-carrier protein] reductase
VHNEGLSTLLLSNKVALVTGGTRDIGRAVCLRLSASGATVVFSHTPTEKSASGSVRTIEEIKKIGGRAFAIPVDLTRAQDTFELVERACALVGDRIDILVNVAGGLIARKTILEMDEASGIR